MSYISLGIEPILLHFSEIFLIPLAFGFKWIWHPFEAILSGSEGRSNSRNYGFISTMMLQDTAIKSYTKCQEVVGSSSTILPNRWKLW